MRCTDLVSKRVSKLEQKLANSTEASSDNKSSHNSTYVSSIQSSVGKGVENSNSKQFVTEKTVSNCGNSDSETTSNLAQCPITNTFY